MRFMCLAVFLGSVAAACAAGVPDERGAPFDEGGGGEGGEASPACAVNPAIPCDGEWTTCPDGEYPGPGCDVFEVGYGTTSYCCEAP